MVTNEQLEILRKRFRILFKVVIFLLTVSLDCEEEKKIAYLVCKKVREKETGFLSHRNPHQYYFLVKNTKK